MITDAIIAQAVDYVGRHGTGDACVAALRAAWPDLRFVACSDDDIPARLNPAYTGDGFNLYLIGGGEHCLALTTDPAAAIGLVVADVIAEE